MFGGHQQNTLDQIQEVAQGSVFTALMADGHLGYGMPIGGVAAYPNQVSVAGVGFDIACGNCAVRTDLIHEDIARDYSELADEIQDAFTFGIGGVNMSFDAPANHAIFGRDEWSLIPEGYRTALMAKARNQLGTIGSGNHYVDVFTGEDGYVWVGVHFGSRGFGHTIASNFMAIAQGEKWGTRVKEGGPLLSLDTQAGKDYWDLMALAGEYAYAGRSWVADQVVRLLGGFPLEVVHNNHNFAWKEEHAGRSLIVVRKGATPAWPGQLGFIGGSMGDNAVIVEGARPLYMGSVLAKQVAAMFSTVHGAGRVMSRTEAGGKYNRKTGEMKKPGKVSQEMMDEWVQGLGVQLRGGGLDESPHAYRRLPEVLEQQGGTIDVLHTLRPRIVVMAGKGR